MTQSMRPSPGPVGTIVEWPKRPFLGVSGTGYRKRRSIVVSVEGGEAKLEPWSRPSRGWRKHKRRTKQ